MRRRRDKFVSSGCAVAAAAMLVCMLVLPMSATAHGGGSAAYETEILGIEPEGLPIKVSVVDGDRLRIENVGDQELTICGYLRECEPYVTLGPKGVFENENSQAHFANLDAVEYGEVPDDAGTGAPKWVRVRREPAFFMYHDHRIHWMGGDTLPPGIDSGDASRQKVNDAKVALKYGSRDVVVSARLYYVGGEGPLAKYGEYALTIAAVLAMLVVFVRDGKRRRRARPDVAVEELPKLPGATE